MSFLQRLCAVYDIEIQRGGTRNGPQLLPIGFIQKKIKYHIMLSDQGEFITAQLLPEKEQLYAVPSTPQAEARTGSNGPPFPLADSLKYLIASNQNDLFSSYIAQLEQWCAAPHAPECLRILLRYLKQKTLYGDLCTVPGLKLKYYSDERDKVGEGPDARSIACFSIEDPNVQEKRLWMRPDVQKSWSRQFYALAGASAPVNTSDTSDAFDMLCYVSGKHLPAMENTPKLLGNAKLISAKDYGFPFQYKGRFLYDRSAAMVSMQAAAKAHNALKWLLERQGFQKYGVSFVGWRTSAPALDFSNGFYPDTFEDHLDSLLNAVLCAQSNNDSGTTDICGMEPAESMVVLLGLQAASDGRMSVIYEQELSEARFAHQLQQWRKMYCWCMPARDGAIRDRPVTWLEICEAVMGADAVQAARSDFKAEKSAAKLMRDLQLRLMHCTIEAQKLPDSMVEAAFVRAVHAQDFVDANGQWDKDQWLHCVATACAMIRAHALGSTAGSMSEAASAQEHKMFSTELDEACVNRDYLYGRLLAAAHSIERAATRDSRTHAMRMMTSFVHQPRTMWFHLYMKLLPALQALGRNGYSAAMYKHVLAQIELRFRPTDRASNQPLSWPFLIGFRVQMNELQARRNPDSCSSCPSVVPDVLYQLPIQRDTLFGCLLAAADHFEWCSAMRETSGKKRTSRRDGCTTAMQLMPTFAAHPMTTWARIHEKLMSYLEETGKQEMTAFSLLISSMEQRFSEKERLSDTPLSPDFLHSYLVMLEALASQPDTASLFTDKGKG